MNKLFLLLFIATFISAKSFEPSLVDLQIISHTFNEEYEQAKMICQDQINQNSSSPKYYYYLINVKIMEYYQKVAELDPQKRDEGRKILNKEIIDYCEFVVDKFDESKMTLENKFYYGTIYGYLARVYGVDGSWWSAFKTAKKAKGMMEEIIKLEPQFYDAYLPLGMIIYYADRMSGITSFIASVLGMSGNRDLGLNYLQLAYDKGTLTFGQSALTLIEVYSSLEGNEYAALPYFENFLKHYPKNKRTINAYCHTLMNIGDLKKTESIIKNDKQNLVDDYGRARLYDLKGNSELAIQYGERALENEKKLFRGGGGAVRYIIVFNSWLTGNSELIKKYEPTLTDRSKELFAIVKSNDKESRWLHDLSVMIAADKPIIEVEYFVRSKPNLYGAKGFEDQFNLLLGGYYFENKLYDKAEQLFWKSVNAANDRDKFSAMRNLVEIYLRQVVDKSKVKNLIAAIEKADNDRLTYRSKELEKKYNL